MHVLSRPSKFQRLVHIAGTTLIILMLVMSVAFAAPTTSDAIQNGIKDGTSQLYSIMTAVVIPIAAVFFAWNAFKALFGGERGMEQAKKNMLTIVVVLALVYLAPVIIQQVSGWFSSTSDGGIFAH